MVLWTPASWRAFRGDSLPVLYRQHLTQAVPALRTHRPDLPGWLQPLTEKMLAKQGYERYQSVDEALVYFRYDLP